MLNFCTDINVINATKKILSYKFKARDLGEAYVVSGNKISKIDGGFELSEKILKKTQSI